MLSMACSFPPQECHAGAVLADQGAPPLRGALFDQLVKELRSEYAAAVTACAGRIHTALGEGRGSIRTALDKYGVNGDPGIMQEQAHPPPQPPSPPAHPRPSRHLPPTPPLSCLLVPPRLPFLYWLEPFLPTVSSRQSLQLQVLRVPASLPATVVMTAHICWHSDKS